MSVIAGRSRVATKYGIVAASQPLAARAGVQILERGGNAVDAAIAANAVLGVVEPQSNGIGGDLFAIVYDARSGALYGLNASGWTPRGLSAALLTSRGAATMPPSGIHTVTVPGAVAGWEALRARLGRLSLADLLAPAMRYAAEGFPVSDVIAAHWAALADKVAAEPEAARTYLPAGRPPCAGDVFRNPDLATSLSAIARDGGAAFYEGSIADAVLAASRSRGGMLNKTSAKARARLIDFERAATDVRPSTLAGLTTSIGADTVYLCAIDREGNIASLIQSVYEGFGAGIVPPGTGFALHNRGALFTLEEGHPNVLAPRKRPLHTIIPAFMQKDDVRIGFGIMGAFNQAQAHAQFVSNVVDLGMDIQQALEAGRFTKPTFTGTDVYVEALVPESVRQELVALGHDVITVPQRTGTFGYGQAVMSDGRGVHFGASDPRHDGAAIPEAPPLA